MITLSRLAAALALAGTAWAAEKYTQEQLGARFYYDLGPAEADVSSYPKTQQAGYAVFKRVCSQCHTTARPLNSPLVKREDWRRYVRRMHARTKVYAGTSVGKKDAEAIIDFLSYDARKRKVEQKAGFEAQTKELRRLFDAVRKERTRLQIEEDKKHVKPFPPGGAGERPRPQ